MRSKATILLSTFGAVIGAYCGPGHAQSAKCATVVECANQMVDIANNLKAQNTALLSKNQDLTARIQNLENTVNNHSSRIDEANKTETSLRNDLNRVNAKSLPQDRGRCVKIDGGRNGEDLWCPAGTYVAGAENTNNSNSTLDMIWCCPSN